MKCVRKWLVVEGVVLVSFVCFLCRMVLCIRELFR